MAYKLEIKRDYRFIDDIKLPVEYANKECIYKITANGKVIFIGVAHNLYITLLDLIRSMSAYPLEKILQRGIKLFNAYNYDVEVDILDNLNDEMYKKYIEEYKPLLNSTLDKKYFEGVKTITKSEKSQLQSKLQYSLGYITGDNEAVYYIDKQMNSYRVLR